MLVPDNYENMSDEELLKALTEIYETEGAARFAFKVIRGEFLPSNPF